MGYLLADQVDATNRMPVSRMVWVAWEDREEGGAGGDRIAEALKRTEDAEGMGSSARRPVKAKGGTRRTAVVEGDSIAEALSGTEDAEGRCGMRRWQAAGSLRR